MKKLFFTSLTISILFILFLFSCEKPKLHPSEPEMITVKGGTFTMGCSDDECWDDELPQHQVTLNNFKISKYPITYKQWVSLLGTTPGFQEDDLPVVHISWNHVQEFITKLNEITGKNYRLPTEAEWEFAARGGTKSKGYIYSGSNNIEDVAWYNDQSGLGKPHTVGTKAPNELGIYDMSGNVLEWCNDCYGSYSDKDQINPIGLQEGSQRVLRGGSWFSSEKSCRVSYRRSLPPDHTTDSPGFRLVLP